MFRAKKSVATAQRHADFSYVSANDKYFDSACQTLRPQPVLDAMQDYYQQYNACGERVKYAWGRRVDEEVEETRQAVLRYLGLSSKEYVTSFTMNTSYGINLLLSQISGSWDRIVTSHIEHNSVFLPTISAAERLGVSRVVLDRADDGSLLYGPEDIQRAIVVVSAMSNVDGRELVNLGQLVHDVHEADGIVIVDAAQAAGHAVDLLRDSGADAYCFSAHKMYSASLGVVVARRELLRSLQPTFIGGGMVEHVREKDYNLLPEEELHTRLEVGLQPWAEIIALGKTISWLDKVRFGGQKAHEHEQRLAELLLDSLSSVEGLHVLNTKASPVISVWSDRHDAHRLALYLSEAGVMVRSGHFCAHHYLEDVLEMPPLLRFSVGLHNTEQDINTAVTMLARFIKEIR